MALRIQVLSPGKVREPWLQAAIAASLQRLNRQTAQRAVWVELHEVADVPDSWPSEKALRAEGQRLLEQIGTADFVVALDLQGQWPRQIAGQPRTLAPDLADWLSQTRGDLVFVIGGSNGLDPTLLARANRRLCLSAMTWTHQMTRLVLLALLEAAWPAVALTTYDKAGCR
jgi:23S rRNA (pseudouridine1915-N3)-methyltransferase